MYDLLRVARETGLGAIVNLIEVGVLGAGVIGMGVGVVVVSSSLLGLVRDLLRRCVFSNFGTEYVAVVVRGDSVIIGFR